MQTQQHLFQSFFGLQKTELKTVKQSIYARVTINGQQP